MFSTRSLNSFRAQGRNGTSTCWSALLTPFHLVSAILPAKPGYHAPLPPKSGRPSGKCGAGPAGGNGARRTGSDADGSNAPGSLARGSCAKRRLSDTIPAATVLCTSAIIYPRGADTYVGRVGTRADAVFREAFHQIDLPLAEIGRA